MQAFVAITPPGGLAPAGAPPDGNLTYFRTNVYKVSPDENGRFVDMGTDQDGGLPFVANPLPYAIPGGKTVICTQVLGVSGDATDMGVFVIVSCPEEFRTPV